MRGWLCVVLVAATSLGCGDSSGSTGSMDGGTEDAGPDRTAPVDGGDTDAPADASPPDAGGDDASSPGCGTSTLGTGDHMLEIEVDGRTREYRVHVPSSYDGSASVPVVLNFHGYTSNAGQQITLSGMNDKADEEGFVAVHAEGWGAVQSWNGGDCCGTAADEGLDDVALARAIARELATILCIDRSRVYATGMSNGAFLSHRIACEGADFVAAIAPVAGVLGIPEEDCAPSRAVPVMHFHGTSDTLVPYEGGGASGFRSVPDTIDLWVGKNGCDDAPEVTYEMGDTTCETWSGCDAGVEVTLCTIDGGGHWWPGGPGSSTDIDATDAMWEMFSDVRLP